jgi:aliphatic nitrilase
VEFMSCGRAVVSFQGGVMGDSFPKLKGAVVQAAPVFLDREATVAKACRFIEESADLGAQVIVFPECYIPAFPHWFSLYPAEHPLVMRFYRELFKNAVIVPSPATDQIGQAARKARAYVVMGINEKEENTYGTLYNASLYFSPDGDLMGKHRKLVPTIYERMVHTGGDGSTLDVYDTTYGGLSSLICGENTNPLAKFTLLASGEIIHAALWPALPMAHQSAVVRGLDIRMKSYAYEGRVFVLSSTGVFTEEMKDAMELDEEVRKQFVDDGAHSGIVNPLGEYLIGPDVHGETVLCAELDIEEVVAGRYMHDITGHYNRFDVFTLNVNRSTHYPLNEIYNGEVPPIFSSAGYIDESEIEKEEA